MTAEKPILDAEAGNVFFKQFIEIWVAPEIQRRQEAGTAPKPFELRAAQVVMFSDGRPVQVRLNEEVAGFMKVRLNVEAKTFAVGDPILFDQVETFEDFIVDEPNAGHITMIDLKGGMKIKFDFRHNKQTARDRIKKAQQFYDVALLALDAGHIDACMENLFAAAEAAAWATMIIFDKSLLTSKKHGHVHSRYNLEAKLGNVEKDLTGAFNTLFASRDVARYSNAGIGKTKEEVAELAGRVARMIDAARRRSEEGMDRPVPTLPDSTGQ